MRTTHTVRGRLLAVTALFVLSACAIYQANEPSTGAEDAGQPVAAEGQSAPTKFPPGVTPAVKPDAPAAAASTPAKPLAKAAPVKAAPAALADAPARDAKAPLKRAPKVATSKAAAPAKPGPGPDPRLVRYVSAEILNVRSAPRNDAPIVARLARGSMFTVTVQVDGGTEWAKIGDAQFVLAKYLSRSEPSVKRRLTARR